MSIDVPSAARDPRGGQASKRYFEGTHRIRPPAETLSRLRPLLATLGITRVANLTGLDRTGVPVAMACRPNSRSVAMFQGKGLTLEAAKVSAIMEAVEAWHAEHVISPLKWASPDEMARHHRIVELERLPRTSAAPIDRSLPFPWVEGHDLQGSGAVWVPFDVVSMNYALPVAAAATGIFQMNSNGIGSGNHPLEAAVHAACEVIERDARTLWERSAPARRASRLIDPESIDDAQCRALLERFEAAGLAVNVWDVTSDVGIAVFVAQIWDLHDEESPPEMGSGCHPARHVALLRALLEAAQVRTTYIAGAREDYLPEHYEPGPRAERLAQMARLAVAPRQPRSYGDVPDFESDCLEDDMRRILVRLRAAELAHAIAVDLTQEAIGIPVVRVIVPGLEGATSYEDTGYFPGARARRIQSI